MEQIKNCFISPVGLKVQKLDFSDDSVYVYELHDLCEKGPSGDPEDFVIEKKPVEVDSYHLNKVIAERAKGTDLKSIVSRVQATGDISLLQQRDVVYGDGTIQPQNLSDAMEEGRRTSEYLDSLSDERKKELIKLSKMSDAEFAAFLAEKEASKVKVEKQPEKEGE